MSNAAEIALEYLHECFEPDYEKGILYWKERPRHHFINEIAWKSFNSKYANTESGSLFNMKGLSYRKVVLGNIRTYAHRIIYMMYHNVILTKGQMIDHIDNNPSNNAISNLRECSYSQNMSNRRISKNNNTGVKNVSYRPNKYKDKPYVATIVKDGKSFRYGFATLEEAETWVKQKRAELHGEFANDGE